MPHALTLAAIVVRLLHLPSGATIDPFGARALMSAMPDGTVSASVTVRGFVRETIAWAPFARRSRPIVNQPPVIALLRQLCEDLPKASTGPVLAGWLADGSAIATMQSPEMVDLDDTSGQYAPVVVHLRSRQCLDMGNGVALGTAGMFAAGYTAFINRVPAPSNVVSAHETFVAMRWHDRTREPLGDGIAIAVDTQGDAAGASVPPGKGGAFDALPHARIWFANRAPIQPAEASPASAAYAIDARGRVTGMLEDQSGRHYAFLWENGAVRRLDDAVRAPGWRFECGYAFGPAGEIVGVGTYRGTPAAFVISGLD
ncbi:MAG: hypothetical protein JO029_04920 [Candidatus Eremiobacteraeota bacterium]|nr:hypothetical protein [Candidatus Eremiobacteraeota bacterium]